MNLNTQKKPTSIFKLKKTTMFPVPKSTIFVEKEHHQIYLGWGYVALVASRVVL